MIPAQKRFLPGGKKQLALLLPAHNEELILAETIKSAVSAGQAKIDIFVVNDGSIDDTRKIATRLLGKRNVLNVKKGGKAIAIQKAIKKFKIEQTYQWVHVADADSVFSPNYFHVYCAKLDPTKYAVAIGFVQSLRGNWISAYRTVEYTYGQHVMRRIQSRLNMVSVFPGPVTCFRTDILKKLEFEGPSLTEDFDITLQVHRKKLGKILYIPQAINYTQDPQTLGDFYRQNLRWRRGFFQGVKKHNIGLRGQSIDVSLGSQFLQTTIFLFETFIFVPFIIFYTHSWYILVSVAVINILIASFIMISASIITKRWNLIGALPYYHFLNWVSIITFCIAFVEVMLLNRFNDEVKGWSTAGRRYKLSTEALADAAG